jgi:hypothetical protein
MRMFIAAGLALAVAFAVGCGGQLVSSPEPVSATVPVLPSASTETTTLQLIGGTKAERRAVRAALAVLGEHSQIGVVQFGYVRTGKGEKGRAVTVESRSGLPSERMEGGWQAELVAPDLVRRLRQANRTFANLTLKDAYHSYDPRLWPSPLLPHPEPASVLQTEIEQRADEAGYEIRRLTALQIGRTPAIAVVIRLSEEHLFDDRDWGWLLFQQESAEDSYPYYLAVEAPEGTRIFAAWWIAAKSVAMGGGADGVDFGVSEPSSDPPSFLDGPTRLDVVLTRGLRQRKHQFRIDCQPVPQGVPDAAAACEQLLRERWIFFLPEMVPACSLPGGSDTVAITGTLGGRQIERHYSPCHSPVLERWLELLGAK